MSLPETRDVVEARVTVTNPTGLHARPAVKFTQIARGFDAQLRLRAEEGGDWVNARSPNAVMKLKLRGGSVLLLRAEGADAAEAVAALVGFVERNFDE